MQFLLGIIFAFLFSYVHDQKTVIFVEMVVRGSTLLEQVLNSCAASIYGIIAMTVS